MRLTNLHRRALRPSAPPVPEPAAESCAALSDPLAEAERIEAETIAAQADADRRKVLNTTAIAEAEAAAKIAAIQHRTRIDKQRREARAAEERARADEAARQQHEAARRSTRAERGRRIRVKIATMGERSRRLAVNLVVNFAVGWGQAMYFHQQQRVILLLAVLLAAGVELVSVTTLDYGIAARKAGRPYRLKFTTAGALAAGVAALNWSHWSSSTQQQGLAIPLAVLSLLCPLLWAWYAAARDAEIASVLRGAAPPARQQRTASTRAALTSTQQHDGSTASTRPATFTILQWLMWFRDTRTAQRFAIRYGIADRDDAYRAAAQHAAAIENGERARARMERLDLAYAEARWEHAERRLDAERARAAQAEAALRAQLDQAAELIAAQRRELESPPGNRYLPTPDEVAAMLTDDEKRDSARDAYRTARLDGVELTGPTIATAFGLSESWARARMREVRAVMRGQLDDSDRADRAEDAGRTTGISR